jgi:segregation and condensation protein B
VDQQEDDEQTPGSEPQETASQESAAGVTEETAAPEAAAGEPASEDPTPETAPDGELAVESLADAEEPGDGEEGPVLPPAEIKAVLEALIFASPQPVTTREIMKVLVGVPKEDWHAALGELQAEYTRDGRGLQIVEIAAGWQITTRPEYNDWVRELLDPKTPTRLSIQALETLAVVAYKQPVTLPEIIDLRGVKSGGVMKTLLEKRLIRITGRKEVVGRPMLYGTTKHFLLHFGLKDLAELPKIEEFAEVLGEEVDVVGLKRAIEAPRPVEVPLSEGDAVQGELDMQPEGADEGDAAEDPDAEEPDLK